MSKYFLVNISAENKKQADLIMNALLYKKLIVGGQITNSPARFLWKGEIIDMEYYNISTYTIEKNKEDIIKEVKSVSIEEVPMISFVEFDGNNDLLKYIDNLL